MNSATVYPEWVQEQRVKGTTVKKVGNTYYLYKRTSKRIPGKKYPQPVDKYIGIITPDGIIERKHQRLAVTSIKVKEFGYSKAMIDCCPEDWKKAAGKDWEEKLTCMILRNSPESYLIQERSIKTEQELNFSYSAQKGTLSRRFYKKYGLEISELNKLRTIYLVYIDNKVFVSDVTEEQENLLEKVGVTMEYK